MSDADRIFPPTITMARYEAVLAEVVRLRAALEQFADPEHWERDDDLWCGPGRPLEIAREALRPDLYCPVCGGQFRGLERCPVFGCGEAKLITREDAFALHQAVGRLLTPDPDKETA